MPAEHFKHWLRGLLCAWWSVVMCKGDYSMFFTRPISLQVFLLTVGSIALVLYKRYRKPKNIAGQ